MEAIVADEVVVKGLKGTLPRLGGVKEHRLLLPRRIGVAHHPLMVRADHRVGAAGTAERAEAATGTVRIVDPAIDVLQSEMVALYLRSERCSACHKGDSDDAK